MKRGYWIAVSLLLSLFISPALRAETKSVDGGEGRPSGILPASSFVAVEAKRLKNAQVLWVNWDVLREMGIERPPEGLTPEFEQKILDAYAYAIPRDSDRPDLFDNEKTKTFYADRYGGNGMGNAGGSGRAAADKNFQVKGIGITPLVDASKTPPEPGEGLYGMISRIVSDYTHSHGGVNVSEAVREAQWSEILHRELPYGANRIAFIISTGTTTPYWGVASEPRALIVRQNSMRPAHFMGNVGRLADKETKSEEKERISNLLPKITKALPVPADKRLKEGTPSYLSAQIKESAERIARKFAAEYARSYYHGATSNSNVEIGGKAIDFGPMTAVHGFPKAQFADDFPAGNTDSLNDAVIKGFIHDIRRYSPEEWRDKLPTYEDLKKVTKEAYADQLDRDFLWLAGTPPEFIDSLVGTEEGLKFTKVLQKVALAGNTQERNTRYGIPKWTGTYDLPEVLRALVRFRATSNLENALNALARAVPDENLRQNLAQAFVAYLDVVERKAEQVGISPDHFAEYQRLAVERRNRPNPELYRNPSKEVLGRLTGWQGGWGDVRAAVSAVMEDTLNKAGKADKCGSFCAEIETRSNPETGMRIRRYYDARAGENRVSLEFPAEKNGQVNYGGKLISIDEAKRIQLRFKGSLNTAPLKDFESEHGLTLVFKDAPLSDLQSTWHRGREIPMDLPGTGRIALEKSRKCPWSNLKTRAR